MRTKDLKMRLRALAIELTRTKCMIKSFMGRGAGMVDGEGVAVKDA